MGLSIKNDRIEAMARELARDQGTGITDVIGQALEEMRARRGPKERLWDKLGPLHEKMRALPDSGLLADRAFYDDLSGETND